MVKIFTSALWWKAVNRPKRRGSNVFSSIFGSSNNGINNGVGERLLKRKESISRKESSFDNFFFLWSVADKKELLSTSENASSSIICVWAICKPSPLSLSLFLKTRLQSSITSTFSERSIILKPKEMFLSFKRYWIFFYFNSWLDFVYM